MARALLALQNICEACSVLDSRAIGCLPTINQLMFEAL
jgi:hypothetical protein